MMDDRVELTARKKRKQRRIRCIAVIIAIIVAFFIGFLIGYVAIKSKSSDDKNKGKKHDDRTADFQKRHEEVMKHHEKFQNTVSEQQLESTLK